MPTQRGFLPIVIIIGVVLVAALAGGGYIYHQHTKAGTSSTSQPTITASPSVSSSSTPVPTPTPQPTVRPTLAPKPKTPVPTMAPTPSPQPTPSVPPRVTNAWYGGLDSLDCNQAKGWAIQGDTDHSEQVTVWIYADAPANQGGIFSGEVTANQPYPKLPIDPNVHVNGDHGFTIPIIGPLKDGKPHVLYFYRIVSGPDNAQLNNTPQVLTCS